MPSRSHAAISLVIIVIFSLRNNLTSFHFFQSQSIHPHDADTLNYKDTVETAHRIEHLNVSPPNHASSNINKTHSINHDQNKDHKFIHYQIIRGLEQKIIDTQCNANDHIIPESFHQPGLFDFNTQIQTNLHMLYVGSSIAAQLSISLQQASTSLDRQVIRYAWSQYQLNTHSSLTPDHGTVSALRVTGFLLNRTKEARKFMAPNAGGGWFTYDIRELKRMVNHWRPVESAFGEEPESPCEVSMDADVTKTNTNANTQNHTNATSSYPCEQQNFDIVIHQPAVEWVQTKPFDQSLTWEVLDEMLNLSFDYLGAKTVILQTIPVSNNMDDLSEVVNVNRMIWTYVNRFRIHNRTDTRQLFVMDIHSFCISLFLQNSIDIGLIDRTEGEAIHSKLQQSSDKNDPFGFLNVTMIYLREAMNQTIPMRKKWDKGLILKKNFNTQIIRKKIGYACGDLNCTKRSYFSRDGMHWCMEFLGGRMNAAVACLAQCSLSESEPGAECERRCNSRYMTLNPVPWQEGKQLMVNGTSLTGFENN